MLLPLLLMVESLGDDELYTATNALAHKLDKSRPTGGVRCIPRSHLLEDVYTYNDFIHSGGRTALLPKLIVCSPSLRKDEQAQLVASVEEVSRVGIVRRPHKINAEIFL